ncbi:MAG: Cys-tRNA(Pro) deacylase [Spirochaetaceae bacterium]|nr:Cys-tRNA(Pro) deacylase [Spirochaetaceae bacterium]
MKKTNAMRILDSLQISYDVREYEDNTDHELTKGAANRTAEKLGLEPETVYKTIVMRSDKKEIFVFCQSADKEINLKKARTVARCKEITPIKQDELLSITGYIRGGCSPLGMKKQFTTFIDEFATLHEKICISAGQRGLQIIISPEDLAKACNAEFVDLEL